MASPVYVQAVRDIYSPTSGLLIVPSGRRGEVKGVAANPLLFTCQFKVNGALVSYTMPSSDLVFADGKIGPMRALFTLAPSPITDVRYVRYMNATDPLVGDGLSYDEGEIEFVLGDGNVINVRADFALGSIIPTLKPDVSC